SPVSAQSVIRGVDGHRSVATRRRGRRLGSTLRIELQRGRDAAIAQAGRGGSVVEDVAEVAAAGGAVRLGPGHEERPVGLGGDRCWIRRGEEAWPAGAPLELRVRSEKLGSAAGAAVDARTVLVPEGAAERALGALLAKDQVLLGGAFGAPLRVGLVGRWGGGRGGLGVGVAHVWIVRSLCVESMTTGCA